jgi:hypothetical protein
MYTPTKIIRTISFIGPFVLAVATARAVVPPPDGGYPNQTTAEGDFALNSLTSGGNNTAAGFEALGDNTTGNDNTATGAQALNFNTVGSSNTAIGVFALLSNVSGNDNTAIGPSALASNAAGSDNTASGFHTLFSNSMGAQNTATGSGALQRNTTGSNNIALGNSAGASLTTGSNNIDIGNAGAAAESRTIRIGTTPMQRATFIAGINGVTVAGGVGVIIDSSGHLGTVVSSERFKDSIRPMDEASEAILSLKPVTFHYKKDLDPDGIPQFGLVAEQVEKVNPDLVARDEQGRPYTVRYEAVNAMLLNEFLKEHKKVEEQSSLIAKQEGRVQEQQAAIADVNSTVAKQASTIENQQKEIQALTEALKAQAVQIQKVSDQLRTQPRRMVVNN